MRLERGPSRVARARSSGRGLGLHVYAIFADDLGAGDRPQLESRPAPRKRNTIQVKPMLHLREARLPKAPIGVLLATLSCVAVAGCVSERSSLENAYRANLASETALNAQIISDRARAQRCERDPTRRECGPR